MENFLAGIVVAAVVLILGRLAYLQLGFAEVRADLPPSSWERILMFSAVHASVRQRAPEMPNPVAPPRVEQELAKPKPPK